MTADAADPTPPAADRRRRRGLALAVVGVLVGAGATTGFFVSNRGDDPTGAPPAVLAGAPTTSAVPTATPSLAAAPTPTRVHTPPTTVAPTPKRTVAPKPTIPHDFVAAAAPTSFRIKGPRFQIKAHVCGMDNVRPLDPPGEQHHTVCWVQEGFGVAPGSRTATTYVLGHSWGQDRLEVLNKISESATQEILNVKPIDVSGVATYPVHSLDGYVITLWTPTGTLHYTVNKAFGVSKTSAASVAPLMNEQTKRRLVIITCAELDGVDYEYNVIVEGRLTSAKAGART